MPAFVFLLSRRRLWIDARQASDLGSVHGSDLCEWPRMAGPADGSAANPLSETRQLLYRNRRSGAGATTAGAVGSAVLGEAVPATPCRTGSVFKSDSQTSFPSLLLDLASSRICHRYLV